MSDEGVKLTSDDRGDHQLHKKARLEAEEEEQPQLLFPLVRTQNKL